MNTNSEFMPGRLVEEPVVFMALTSMEIKVVILVALITAGLAVAATGLYLVGKEDAATPGKETLGNKSWLQRGFEIGAALLFLSYGVIYVAVAAGVF